MTRTRALVTILAAFFVAQIMAVVIHGFILSGDYEPFEGTLLRSGFPPPWQMLFLPVSHLSFIIGLVWVYARLPRGGSRLVGGIALGMIGWLVGQAPLWLIWYAQQPWPGDLVVKQLALELISSLVVGLTIAMVAGAGRAVRHAAVASV